MRRHDPYAARLPYFALAHGAATVRSVLFGLLAVEFVWVLTGSLLVPWPIGQTGTPLRTFAVHLAFLSIAATTFWIVHRFQRRNPVALIGPLEIATRDFAQVSRAVLLLLGALYLVVGGVPWETAQAMPVLRWALLLPFACIAVLIQTGAEEILYRGYLQQSLGATFDHPAAWMILPSVLFGLSHYNPAIPFDATLQHMIWTTAFGIAAADLTARTGSLGAAIGLHFAFNLPLVVLIAAPGELSGFSLFFTPGHWSDEPQTAVRLAIELLYLWMVWMAARIAIRR